MIYFCVFVGVVVSVLAVIGAGFLWFMFVKVCKVLRLPFACWVISHGYFSQVHWREKLYRVTCERCGRPFLGSFNLGGPMDLMPWTEEMDKAWKAGANLESMRKDAPR